MLYSEHSKIFFLSALKMMSLLIFVLYTFPSFVPITESKDANPTVIIETNKGSMKIELWPDKAPNTVANFLKYVDTGFYDGLIFDRVIPDFVI